MTKRKDAINFISKLTFNKITNALKNYSGYFYSRITKKAIHYGMPMSISIEPTTSCNLRCPQCPSGLRSFSRPTGMLEEDLFAKVIDELEKTLLYLILYFQGEPYLNKDFLEMVKYASNKNIYTATSSNGHYLTDENCKKTIEAGLDKLIISFDGISQETYKKYRVGGKLDKVLKGTKKLVEYKRKMKSSTPHIVWQFIVFKHNEHEIPELKRTAKELGVDELVLKTAQIYDYENGSDLLPTDEKYRRYTENEDHFVIKNKLLNHCWRMWQGCVITWDGKIVPCCFDKDASHQIGNLKVQNFKDIWHGKSYQSFRQAVLKSRANIDICANCTEGTKVFA